MSVCVRPCQCVCLGKDEKEQCAGRDIFWGRTPTRYDISLFFSEEKKTAYSRLIKGLVRI